MGFRAEFVWPRVFAGWLLGTACAYLAVSLLVPLLPKAGGNVSRRMLIGAIPAWLLTFPALLLRVALGPEAGLILALLTGAAVGLALSEFTYELFLPLAHRMTAGPSLGIFAVYAGAGAMAGAIWFWVERRHGA